MAMNSFQPQLFFDLISERPESVANLTIHLWESIASELIPLIGKDGFVILYARCLAITQTTFPWLAANQGPQTTDTQFILLKKSLEGRAFTEAHDASKTLFITFIDILTTLIGESLTTSILQTVWNEDVSAITDKEFPS